ncbi:CLUMA_CG020492, isoform A [Clunio marinus]|uniref:CLUMA_CG020492, isoform A n=1 Tax=Clunio marinus TaxID=568069 RepID=A0A1J1J560_9DIPT|nr:CLUMA_CG020492, isoform A [Clunio marinus]
MSSTVNIQKNELMNLPEEILLYILKFVNISSRSNVSQVCRKFYELVCTLEKDCLPLKLSYKQICDENMYSSIINTSRMFTDLTISVDVVPNIDPILNILVKFGERIEKFTFTGRYVPGKIKSTVLESQLAEMLNCIPNVEELTFEFICVIRDMHWSDELPLYKLKKLTMESDWRSDCDFPIIFNQLPKDVVTEMSIRFNLYNENFKQFINQQTQITKLIMKRELHSDLSVLNLPNLKHFTYWHIGFNENFPEMIRQHPKLRSLDLCDGLSTNMNNEIFEAICELDYLESLKTVINEELSVDVFKSLANVIHLRELHLIIDMQQDIQRIFNFQNFQEDDVDDDGIQFLNIVLELSMMKFLQIETLSITGSENFTVIIPQEIVFQFIQNFQNLKHLRFEHGSINIIGTVLKYFIKLETFDFCVIRSEEEQDLMDEDLSHENLKEFKVSSYDIYNTRSILYAISACPSLELIEISKECDISNEDLQQIVDDHPKLKYLTLDVYKFSFENETAEVIQSAARRLQRISLSGLSRFLSFETIKECFKEEFPCIKHFERGNGTFELMMKKRGPLK